MVEFYFKTFVINNNKNNNKNNNNKLHNTVTFFIILFTFFRQKSYDNGIVGTLLNTDETAIVNFSNKIVIKELQFAVTNSIDYLSYCSENPHFVTKQSLSVLRHGLPSQVSGMSKKPFLQTPAHTL
jgi:hypothetical protein